jgi:chemotaxis protein methyltransferase CheR
VMIYFNNSLQDRVHRLFYQSLARLGVLGLGQRESLRFSPHEASYEMVDAAQCLFRKVE